VNEENLLHTFSSTLISSRTSFFPPGRPERSRDMLDAIDAAIVRVQLNGLDYEHARNNEPFEFVSIHTCKTSEAEFPFPVEADATVNLSFSLSLIYLYFMSTSTLVHHITQLWL